MHGECRRRWNAYPVLLPPNPQIVGVGKNYKAHVAELAAGDNPLWKNDPEALKEPLLFIKPTSSCARLPTC
eukprot:COSAG02_NODE_217_length_28595_cov_19.642371_20_plen_71_part_00